jgi:hypothetical protein
MTSDWACTSRGYIQTKYLDIDPIIAEADAA